MEREEVAAMIRARFPERPLSEMTLHQGKLADESLTRKITDREWIAARARDDDITWRKVSDDVLLDCEAALAHLDEQGFVYYLPAYLDYALRHLRDPSFGAIGNLVGSVVFAVTHRSDSNLRRLSCLTGGQVEAVIAFLRFVRDHSEVEGPYAGKALERYWEGRLK